MLTIFGRKKVTTDRVAHIFAHNIVETVESGFEDVAGFINDSPEFVVSPNIAPVMIKKLAMVLILFIYLT